MHTSTPSRIENVPYNGLPVRAFYSISLTPKHSKEIEHTEFFAIRQALLPFLAAHNVQVTFPFGYLNKRQKCLMVCFEAPPELKKIIDEFCYNTMDFCKKYRMTLLFTEL